MVVLINGQVEWSTALTWAYCGRFWWCSWCFWCRFAYSYSSGILVLDVSTMLHLELPHINVLSKIDLIKSYGKLGRHWITKHCSLVLAVHIFQKLWSNMVCILYSFQPWLLYRCPRSIIFTVSSRSGSMLSQVQVWSKFLIPSYVDWSRTNNILIQVVCWHLCCFSDCWWHSTCGENFLLTVAVAANCWLFDVYELLA